MVNISGAVAADYDWDGDVDIVYVASPEDAGTAPVVSIENLNQVTGRHKPEPAHSRS